MTTLSSGFSREVADHQESDGPLRVPDGKALFFCIGAQKAGTSWLSRYFRQHPECHFSVDKEMHYFDVELGGFRGMVGRQVDILRHRVGNLQAEPQKNFGWKLDAVEAMVDLLQMYRVRVDGDRAYLRLMLRSAGAKRLMCDFTPEYGHLPEKAFRHMATFGEHRPYFLFVMRDPLARLWSQIRMELQHRSTPYDDWPDAARRIAEDLLGKGRLARQRYNNYKHTVKMLERCVDRDRWRVMFMSELLQQTAIDELCDFLGIPRREADFSPVHEGRSLPLPEDLRRRMRASLDETYRFVEERFPDRRPADWAWDG
jgi:hypothetical protein